ncbi:5'-3' exonuclease [Bacillus sp. FJAT-45350]|uniref:5'-3' exonuclease n=1 Tax=Bacillus sp. FJAT-45350 TaxID=2011014 RepID=UPI000BB69B83|nr:5'-3' exonuclease H3TH domain-containing protein [Bacillus sp. FJAT-45350]
MDKKKLLLIDGFNLLSRGYFATSYGRDEDQLSKNSDGLYTNGLSVFFQKLFNLISEHEISHLAVAWDVKREESIRRLEHDFYKETRSELPPPLIQQYETCTKILDAIGIKQLVTPPYEADDAIGTLACKWSKEIDESCYIYSNDKDLLQLLDKNVSQIIAGKKGEVTYSVDHFQTEYEITPEQWVDVKALLGDKSDNIPGCPGVGEKSALPLIQQYTSIENLYEGIEDLDPKFNRYKKKLIAGKETSFLSKKLSKIICDIPELGCFEFNDLQFDLDKDKAKEVLEGIELKIKLY